MPKSQTLTFYLNVYSPKSEIQASKKTFLHTFLHTLVKSPYPSNELLGLIQSLHSNILREESEQECVGENMIERRKRLKEGGEKTENSE